MRSKTYKSTENVVSDALSRAPLEHTFPETDQLGESREVMYMPIVCATFGQTILQSIKNSQDKDENIQKIIKQLGSLSSAQLAPLKNTLCIIICCTDEFPGLVLHLGL